MNERFSHGLIVGKFYPPHRGHQFLIERAAARCTEVSVLVMAAGCETLALAERTAWLQASCADLPAVTVSGIRCDVPVDFSNDAVWTAQLALMRAALERDCRPQRVDAVFSSEPYGDELAARVVVVGAESTGTSTIARMLAEHYRCRGGPWARTQCVTEAGRDYTVSKWQQARAAASEAGRPEPALEDLEWAAADFDAVAAEQARRENEAASAGSPLVVCDTDAFATAVWERRYLGVQARDLQPWATTELPHREIYLLTSHEEVPWHDDGLREGDLQIREAMTGWFAAALTAAGHSWVLLAGSLTERCALAVRVTDMALARRATFGPAVTDDALASGRSAR
jgi:nicotinamide riboside kinase